MPFENIAGIGENAGNKHFLLFPQCFKPIPDEILIFCVTFILSSANASNRDLSKIFFFDKELIHF